MSGSGRIKCFERKARHSGGYSSYSYVELSLVFNDRKSLDKACDALSKINFDYEASWDGDCLLEFECSVGDKFLLLNTLSNNLDKVARMTIAAL